MIKDKQNQLKDSREKAAVPGPSGKQAEEEKKEEKQDKITYEYLTLLNSQRELDGVRIATEQTMTPQQLADEINSDHGADVIATQGVDGHKLEVCNIRVHEASSHFWGLNNAYGNTPPKELFEQFEGKYLLTAEVDGHLVQKQITEAQADKLWALDPDQRLRFFNRLFGVQDGNSVRVPDKMYDDKINVVKMDSELAQMNAMEIITSCDKAQKAIDRGETINITSLQIAQGKFDGMYYLQAVVNGNHQQYLLSQEQYNDLVDANNLEPINIPTQAKQERSNSMATNLAEKAAMNFEHEYQADQEASQEQTISMSR